MGSLSCYPWVIDYAGTVSIRPVVPQDGLPWVIKTPLTIPDCAVGPTLPPPPPKPKGTNPRAKAKKDYPVCQENLADLTGIPLDTIRNLVQVC